MIRRVGTDPDGWPVLGRSAAGETQTLDQVISAELELLQYVEAGRFPVTRPRQIGVDADGWAIIGKY